MSALSLPPRVRPIRAGSFAYNTMKERLPVIVTKTISRLTKDLSNKEGGKEVVAQLVALKYEQSHNKPLTPIVDGRFDAAAWNEYLLAYRLENHLPREEDLTWMVADMLVSEGYLYRRMRQACLLSTGMEELDVFETEKQKAFQSAEVSILALSSLLLDSLKELDSSLSAPEVATGRSHASLLEKQFHNFMEFALWGNKTDLSLHPTATNQSELLRALQSSELSQLDVLRPAIIASDVSHVLDHLRALQASPAKALCVRVDIILDNAGYELFTDLILAEWLVSAGLAQEIHFHTKEYGWYVSDVNKHDFLWTVEQLASASAEAPRQLGQRWKRERLAPYFSESHSGQSESAARQWTIESHPYWTLPGDFHELKTLAPDLYQSLSKSDLLIFKGDLNYRRLIADREWTATTPFAVALGVFRPAPLVTLRTLKAEVIAGLAEGVEERVSAADPSWLSNGKWALMSYAPAVQES